MAKQQADRSNYISNLDIVALILFFPALISALIGTAYSLLDAPEAGGQLPFAAGWDHNAVIIIGVIGVGVSAILGVISHIQKKYVQ